MRNKYPTTVPCIYPIKDREWKLYVDWEMEIVIAKVKFLLSVQRGFISDFASIPRIFWSIVGHPLMGKTIRASLAHDALYGTKQFSRSMCDEIFYNILVEDHVSKIKANTLWICVRSFGWRYYGRNKKMKDLVELNSEN
jgi:hypothetical protein